MAKVRAAYNYSYNYEGKKISFKKDEEFQLLNKSNNDWWQVRRWMGGNAQDIYVPAVYVEEVQDKTPQVQEERDPTYMNLDDLKVPKSIENGTKSTPADKSPPAVPILLNRPGKSRNSIKRGSLERNSLERNKNPQKKGSTEKENLDGSLTMKPNGLNPGRPVSPTMLRRLNKGGNSSGLTQAVSSNQGSLKRGENLAPPPISSKPRSKSSVADQPAPVSESSLDSGTRNLQRQTSGSKYKIPPIKPKPQKVSSARPMSCMPSASDMDTSNSVEVGNPIVSELSHLLLRKNPHLTSSEHKAVGKTMSSGAVDLASPSSGDVSGDGLSKSLDAKGFLSQQFPTSESVPVKPEEVMSPLSAPPPPTSPPALPAGWTEHMTSSGQTYYYNAASGQSSWGRPQGGGDPATDENKHLEKVAPRGWTKEINLITRTPVYTNSRTGERWGLGCNAKGNYYYNMTNSSLTLGELPDIVDAEDTAVYDTLAPVTKGPKSPSTPDSSPLHKAPGRSKSNSTAFLTETIASSLSDVLKRHGYLHRKRLFDSHGKKSKDKNWLKFYVTLQRYELLFYPDMKTKDAGTKPLAIFCLLQTTVSPYTKDKKKANVFQVSSHLGEQFLLQAETSNLMNEWYSTIQTAIDQANHDYKDNPEKFRSLLVEPVADDYEGSPKIGSFRRDKKASKITRNQSASDEMILEEEEDLVMDNMEISAAKRSGHIRGRLLKLMAKRPEKDTLKNKGILEDAVFGTELSTLCEQQGASIPEFFTHFMQHIEKVGLDVVGIYRLSGNAASINKLRYLVEQDQNIDLDSPEWSDVNIVTGCLKLYLRELPDPIVPFRLFKPLIEAARAPSQPQRIQQIACRIKELPNANYCTLKALIQHLLKVVEYGSVNKMQSTNVAIVFGPTVMRAETDSIEMATLMPVQNGIVEIMVNEFDSIFRK